MTQEERKMLAEILLQHDSEIERLWDIIYELKLDAIDAGRALPDAEQWKKEALARKQHGGVVSVQRQRLRKYLGLE